MIITVFENGPGTPRGGPTTEVRKIVSPQQTANDITMADFLRQD